MKVATYAARSRAHPSAAIINLALFLVCAEKAMQERKRDKSLSRDRTRARKLGGRINNGRKNAIAERID